MPNCGRIPSLSAHAQTNKISTPRSKHKNQCHGPRFISLALTEAIALQWQTQSPDSLSNWGARCTNGAEIGPFIAHQCRMMDENDAALTEDWSLGKSLDTIGPVGGERRKGERLRLPLSLVVSGGACYARRGATAKERHTVAARRHPTAQTKRQRLDIFRHRGTMGPQ